MGCSTPEGAADSSAPRYRVYDPLRAEWATPYPAARPMTSNRPEAAVHDSEPAAVMHGRQLIGPARPWLVVQPVCPICEAAEYRFALNANSRPIVARGHVLARLGASQADTSAPAVSAPRPNFAAIAGAS